MTVVDLAVAVPDPEPQVPPGFEDNVATLLGWGRWFVIVAAVGGLLYIAIMFIAGRRNRSAAAMDALIGLPWIVAGLVLAGSVAALVGMFA